MESKRPAGCWKSIPILRWWRFEKLIPGITAVVMGQYYVCESIKQQLSWFAPDFWAKRITKAETFSYVDADPEIRRMIDEVSPVVYLKETSAPLLHIHGDQDDVISPKHADHLKKHAEAVGAPVTIQMVQGAGHGWWAPDLKPDRKTIEDMTIDFAIKYTREGK